MTSLEKIREINILTMQISYIQHIHESVLQNNRHISVTCLVMLQVILKIGKSLHKEEFSDTCF